MTICIRLTHSDPKTKKKQVHSVNNLDPTAPISILFQVCLDRFAPKAQPKEVQLLVGFPPKPLMISASSYGTIQECGIEHQSNIIVNFEVVSQTTKNTNNQSNQDQSTIAVSKHSASGRPRRAAAIAASETFVEADKAMRALEQTSKKSSTKWKTPSFATKNTSPKRTRVVKMEGSGRSLDTGEVVVRPSPARKRGGESTLSSQDDVATSLLASVNAGSSGKLNTTLRHVMRGAVAKSYETSRAYVRVTAVASGQIKYIRAPTASSSEHHVGLHKVEYSKGVEGRGNFFEEVDILAKEPLEAVVRAVYNTRDPQDDQVESGRNMLKGMYMSQVSPRVYWSLIFHYPNSKSSDEALQRLCPDLDWSYLLTGRSRQMSEKARENARQERVRKGLEKDNQEVDELAALKAVQQVEEAMEKMHAYNIDDRRNRAARAALKRFETKLDSNEWKLVTPTDEDLDELRECILDGPIERDQEFSTLMARTMLGQHHIHNWRELANENASQLHCKLHPANCCCSGSCLSEAEVESWIDQAQERSVDEIMLEIVDGRHDVLERLISHACTGTPKDLYNWRAIPHMLSQKLAMDDVGQLELQTWCARAGIALSTCEWLEWFATPV